jgi:hypothetical protein
MLENCGLRFEIFTVNRKFYDSRMEISARYLGQSESNFLAHVLHMVKYDFLDLGILTLRRTWA